MESVLPENILVIADGAAFGPEIDRVLNLLSERKNAFLYLPESFEWLILSSDLWYDKRITKILNTPYNYIESQEYFSWERYFTALLIERSKDTYLAYSKKLLNKNYLTHKAKSAILSKMRYIALDTEGTDMNT